ncbi:cold-shock protein [Nocardia sp. NPDC058176]|uniref:cold-shock protein n=1 Tax=Nocardia sp. NPDC058176 TaxID=3346368 RepID=UPI0036DEA3C9
MTQSGTVKWFNVERGFGFVVPDEGGADLLVEHSDVLEHQDLRLLRQGRRVEFDRVVGAKGPQARRVHGPDGPRESFGHSDQAGHGGVPKSSATSAPADDEHREASPCEHRDRHR